MIPWLEGGLVPPWELNAKLNNIYFHQKKLKSFIKNDGKTFLLLKFKLVIEIVIIFSLFLYFREISECKLSYYGLYSILKVLMFSST